MRSVSRRSSLSLSVLAELVRGGSDLRASFFGLFTSSRGPLRKKRGVLGETHGGVNHRSIADQEKQLGKIKAALVTKCVCVRERERERENAAGANWCPILETAPVVLLRIFFFACFLYICCRFMFVWFFFLRALAPVWPRQTRTDRVEQSGRLVPVLFPPFVFLARCVEEFSDLFSGEGRVCVSLGRVLFGQTARH